MTRKIEGKHFSLFMAAGWLVALVLDVIRHGTVLPMVDSALVAYHLYMWWKGGGGDDTKRRLRKLRKKFQPVRRMAPVTA
jgi:hypothetical protein